MKNDLLKVGLVQQACNDNRGENWAATEVGIRSAATQGARLILLQELHNGIYFCQNEDLARFDDAESIPGPTTEFLGDLAQKLHIVIVGSVFERRAPGLYHNTAVVLDADGSIAGSYRKMHIPDDPGFQEKFYFTPGDQGFNPIKTSVGNLGVLVCWDQWYPEAARLMALAGADLLLYPTAIGWDPKDDADEKQRQRDSWITIQRAHAIANGVPVITCNRVGFEPNSKDKANGIQFWGTSFIAGPQGEILAQAPDNATTALVIPLDLRRNEHTRRIWPFFRDRRIDAYADLTKRYGK